MAGGIIYKSYIILSFYASLTVHALQDTFQKQIPHYRLQLLQLISPVRPHQPHQLLQLANLILLKLPQLVYQAPLP